MHKINIKALQSSNIVLSSSKAYIQAYAYLQHIIQKYITSSIAPLLLESLKLISRYENVEIQGKALFDIVQDNTKFIQIQDNQDYV
jgi:hypothetical protein